MSVYARSAAYYDAIYRAAGKDYPDEARRIDELVAAHKRSSGTAILDIGCGTGMHMAALAGPYTCEGLDVDRAMLAIAAERLPNVPLHAQDMIGFNLEKRFDVIVSLFGAVNYVPSVALLNQTLLTFARHLRPGGVVIVEPWMLPADWIEGYVGAHFADEPELKVARMSVSRRDGNVGILNFHYMVAARDGVRTFTEPHRLMLFTEDQYRGAFATARLDVSVERAGPGGRLCFIGTSIGP